MLLKELNIINFKNCSEANLQFTENVNCFLGNNGEGKTNLLDAIYYLSFCKSYFNPIDSQNIKHEEPFFVVEGIYDRGDKDEVIYCGLKRNQKKQFKRNKKNYERLADHIGTIPLVMISPIDILLIIEGSDGRRKFIDGIISQYDKSYLNNLLNYNKALHHRNLLLKSFWLNRNFDKDSLEIWDEQLIKYGVLIHNSRKTFVDDFTPIFQKYYTQLSNNKETVALIYQSQLNDEKFEDLLINNLAKDKANHYTNFGIHKDDLVFEIDGFPMKKFGSQGQQKTYLMALKLAQAELIKNISEKKVIFLLDDIFDKLDDNRMKQLLAIVSNGDFGQIFITDTSLSRIPDILTEEKINFKAFKIEEGAATDV
ncbi:MAG: DNA replication and repair protein RecF [Flavobacteriales bacterium]|nr:DNA replication and repair protein RecF [Flavobacteriales bacterium]MCB9363992.1 DNA replication and repair protein RecF [Flavobacteriales bacterium]